MAKKKKKKAKSLLPKRIAGVKVPKALRKGRAAGFLASPLGAAIVADVLLAAGAFGVAKEAQPGSAVRRLAGEARHDMESVAHKAREGGEVSKERLKEAFAAASAAFADTLRQTAEAIEPAKKAAAREASAPVPAAH